ncbi:MAG: hypothetical protein J6D11_08075 [Clostridia bacterium]|nr:hypothetical protein [Clostridia bacterium]
MYPDAYASVTEGKAKAEIPKLDWNSIIASIPATYYEEYPGLHGKPLSAVLYKNGERTELSLDDERLVRLWNFYNNIVYNCKYAYTRRFHLIRILLSDVIRFMRLTRELWIGLFYLDFKCLL